jgi:hypothetical protein
MAPIGRYERYPGDAPVMKKGRWCAPSQSQMAALIGSEVLPVALPAVAQAIKEINPIGSSNSEVLRKTCANETARTRCNIYDYRPRMARIKRAVSLGVCPTFTPAASRASFLACAVPDEPETIAPACPIVLPSGAVNPAT